MEHRLRWTVLIMVTLMYFDESASEPLAVSTIAEVFTTNTPPTSCHLRHDTTGEVNVVFLLDRSRSLGSSEFPDIVRPLVRQILEEYYILRPTATRVAVVLFAEEGTVVIDYISASGPIQPYQCEMFATNGKFDLLVVRGGKHSGENVIDGFEKVSAILTKGSKKAKKHLWLITDAHEFTHGKKGKVKIPREDLLSAADRLKDSNVTLFGVGAGNFHGITESKLLQELVTQPHQCYYFSSKDSTRPPWDFTTKNKNGDNMWRPMQNSSLCHQLCNETCECLDYSPESATRCTGTHITATKTTTRRSATTTKTTTRRSATTAKTTTTPEAPGGEDGSWIVFLIIGVSSFAFFVIIVTICICACRKMCCFNCKEKKRDDEPAPSESDDYEYIHEDIYENHLVRDIWEAALTATRQNAEIASTRSSPPSTERKEVSTSTGYILPTACVCQGDDVSKSHCSIHNIAGSQPKRHAYENVAINRSVTNTQISPSIDDSEIRPSIQPRNIRPPKEDGHIRPSKAPKPQVTSPATSQTNITTGLQKKLESAWMKMRTMSLNSKIYENQVEIDMQLQRKYKDGKHKATPDVTISEEVSALAKTPTPESTRPKNQYSIRPLRT